MSIFDSIIKESGQKFGSGDKAGNLLSSLLNLITDQTQGGFAGFLDRFRQAGLGATADSWINTGDNIPLSNEQVESALGTEVTKQMAGQAGIEWETAKSALGLMIPSVVDRLTPDGGVPTDDDLLSRIGGYLSGVGSATVSTTGVMAGETLDRFGTAAETVNRRDADDLIDEEYTDDSPLKWLIPLILLGLMIAVGWAFCGKSKASVPTATNVNVDSAATNATAKSAINSNSVSH